MLGQIGGAECRDGGCELGSGEQGGGSGKTHGGEGAEQGRDEQQRGPEATPEQRNLCKLIKNISGFFLAMSILGSPIIFSYRQAYWHISQL